MSKIAKINNQQISQKNNLVQKPKMISRLHQQLTKDTVSFNSNPIKVTGVKLTTFIPVLAKSALAAVAKGVKEMPYILNLNAVRDGNNAKVADFMLEEVGIKLAEACKMSDNLKLELLKKNLNKTEQFLNIIKP
jgi:hypothetical protein